MIGSKPVALDTNIAVQLLNDAPHVISWLGAFGTLVLPVTALGELNFGAHNSTRAVQNLDRLRQLVARCYVLEVDAATAETYGELRLLLKRAGRPIPENDVWIAASCLGAGLPLATLDAHFVAVPGLTVVHP